MTTLHWPRRIYSFAQAELILLGRNRLTMFNALFLPLASVLLMKSFMDGEPSPDSAAVAVTVMIGFLLLFVVFYNLLSAYVTRRDELVLKRLRTGEASDAEILAGVAAPSLFLTLTQIVVLVVAATALLGLPMPGNLLLLVTSVFGGALVFVALALITAPMTKTAEAAQLTTMPVMMLSIVGAGVASFSPDSLPSWAVEIARFTPLAPVSTLTQHAWIGTTLPIGELLKAGAILVGWIVAGGIVAARFFRWEPRT